MELFEIDSDQNYFVFFRKHNRNLGINCDQIHSEQFHNMYNTQQSLQIYALFLVCMAKTKEIQIFTISYLYMASIL